MPGCKSVDSRPQLNAVSLKTVRICSQNIFRYSERNKKWSQKKQERQARYLISRMHRADCDVVALQEVVGNTIREGQAVADDLAKQLSIRRGFPYVAIVAGSRTKFIRNAILYRQDVFSLEKKLDLSRKPLARIQHHRGATGHFARGPLFVHLRLRGSYQKEVPDFLIATMHFKSKLGGYRDGYGTDYEILRTEMAEVLRNEVVAYQRSIKHELVPVILGDRNSSPGSASALVLTGQRRLSEFQNNNCRLDEALRPRCKRSLRKPAEFVELFASKKAAKTTGSHKYRGRETLIDEILIREKDRKRLIRANGSLAIGMQGQYFKGSDHKLLWAQFSI